jgi:DNA mismatch repair protein MutS
METKEAWPGSFLFFQIGDFFELFFEDAERAAPLLDLALTSRQKIDGVPVPMCGVPLAACDLYVNRLASLGHKVVVFEQEGPSPPPGKLAPRRLARVVTPGTVVSEDGQPAGRYMAVILHEGSLAAAGGPAREADWRDADPSGEGGPAGPAGGASRGAASRTARGRPSRPASRVCASAGAAPADRDPPEGGWWFLAAADLSTGDFQLARARDLDGLGPEISAFAPQEILHPDPPPPGLAELLGGAGVYTAPLGPEALAGAEEALETVFGKGLAGHLPELSGSRGGLAACGAAVKRLLELSPGSSLAHLSPPRLLWTSPSLSLDEAALRNLELVRSLRDGGRRGTLLELLDMSATPMGSRTLQDWLTRPSRDRAEVEARHGAVEELLSRASDREELAGLLKSLKDLERALSRLALGRGTVRDLYLVKNALDLAPRVMAILRGFAGGGLLRRLAAGLGEVLDPGPPAGTPDTSPPGGEPVPAPPAGTQPPAPGGVSGAGDRPWAGGPAPAAGPVPSLFAAIPQGPPGPAPPADAVRGLRRALDLVLAEPRDPAAPEGAAVRPGTSPVLDELRALERDGRRAVAALEAEEKRRTGIQSLKVGYNRVFGYYLEIPRRHASLAPAGWTRRQTLAGAERYASQELVELEGRILSAGEKREALEQRILRNLRRRAGDASAGVKRISRILAYADALRSLAEAARRYGWTRPRIVADDVIDIKAGRHPVVEASLARGDSFVANDVRLSPKERILIVTGPNMAGKSTILRQTALIVVLCQMGSFVPAEEARLSIRDAVFTRVGAADDLAGGHSTFMVEMSETARILARATPRSLVILDEVGRGTSTFDGLAIAWAVAEYLHDRAGRGVPTLFATHYHELVDLARSKPLAVNYNVAVRKWQGKVVFLRKLLPGGTSRSYGLAVAALAGLPKAVTERAAEVLQDLLEGAKRSIRPQIRPRGLLGHLEPPPAQDPEARGLWAPDGLDEGLPAGPAPAAPPPPGQPCPPAARSPAPPGGTAPAAGPAANTEGTGAAQPRPLLPGAELEAERERLVADISAIETESLTPLEALNLVHALKTRAGGLL